MSTSFDAGSHLTWLRFGLEDSSLCPGQVVPDLCGIPNRARWAYLIGWRMGQLPLLK